jgi:hypothetical protein
MRLSRTSIQNAVAGVALGSGLLASATAQAGLVYDLRFADGSHTKTLSGTGTVAVDLWVKVSGTNGTQTDEGLTSSYVTILSTQVSGGGALVAGGLTGGTVQNGFNEAGSRNGSAAELNGDAIIDWGATVTAGANTNYMLARNATVGGVNSGGTLGGAVDAITWEFKIASFTVDAAALGTGRTDFNIVQPNAKNTVGAFTYSTAKVDNTTFNVSSSNTQGAFAGSLGVTLLVPEPASIGLLGAAAVGLLGRRRK